MPRSKKKSIFKNLFPARVGRPRDWPFNKKPSRLKDKDNQQSNEKQTAPGGLTFFLSIPDNLNFSQLIDDGEVPEQLINRPAPPIHIIDDDEETPEQVISKPAPVQPVITPASMFFGYERLQAMPPVPSIQSTQANFSNTKLPPISSLIQSFSN